MKQSVHIVELGILLLAVGLATDAWMGARNDSAKLKETLSSQNLMVVQAESRERDRDKVLASMVAAIESEKRRVRTPQQAATALAALVPDLPRPISVTPPNSIPSEGQTEVSTHQPERPQVTQSIPVDDIKPLYDQLEDCRICAVERDAAREDIKDAQNRIAALTKERDAAIAAAKGGTFWTRTKHGAKWLSLGLLIGTVSSTLFRHH